jgi:hypothetical protein
MSNLIITSNTATQLAIPGWTIPPGETLPGAGSGYQIVPVYGDDYGDNLGLAFEGGVFYAVWGDNSNSTASQSPPYPNPDGALKALDLYTAQVTVSAAPSPLQPSGLALDDSQNGPTTGLQGQKGGTTQEIRRAFLFAQLRSDASALAIRVATFSEAGGKAGFQSEPAEAMASPLGARVDREAVDRLFFAQPVENQAPVSGILGLSSGRIRRWWAMGSNDGLGELQLWSH